MQKLGTLSWAIVVLVAGVISAFSAEAQQKEKVNITRYDSWQSTGYLQSMEADKSGDDGLSWKVTPPQQRDPHYRGFALKRLGVIKEFEFDYEISGSPEGSVRLELWDGLGRYRLWDQAVKETGEKHVSLTCVNALNGLEFRLTPNAPRLKKGVSVNVKNVVFFETKLPSTKTFEFSGDDFRDWELTKQRGSFESSAEDGLFLKTTKKVCNDSNGWSRGYKLAVDHPVVRLAFDYSSFANNNQRLILQVLDGHGHVIWDKELPKGETDSTHVVLDPVFATGAVQFRLSKNDYIFYGGTSVRFDHVKMALVKPKIVCCYVRCHIHHTLWHQNFVYFILLRLRRILRFLLCLERCPALHPQSFVVILCLQHIVATTLRRSSLKCYYIHPPQLV